MITSEELQGLFQAERAARPPALAAEHGWNRLALDLAANVPPLPVAVGPLKAGLWLVPKWILAGFTLGVVGAGVATSVLAPKTVLGNAALRAAPSVSVSSGVTSTATAQPTIDSAPIAPSVGVPLGVASTHGVAAPSVAAPTTFDAEFKLISRAKSALDARDFGAAGAALSEHAEQFPAGVFATERDALRVLMSCTRGPKDEMLARRFAEQHPGSPLAERLEHACGAAAPVPASPPSGSNADFSKLINDAPGLGERMAEPSGGEQR